MINRVVLVGRLTKDPELKYTQTGIAVTRFTLAVNRAFANAQGEREADFITCVAWRKQAENIANYLRKGSLAGVDGRIQTGSFEGQDGKRVYTTEVVADSTQFLEPRNANTERQQTPSYGGGAPSYNAPSQNQGQGYNNQQSYQPNQQNMTRVDNDPFQPGGGPIEVTDDDLPF
ncbi:MULTISPECIES: single-stranded DNA-binding protein [Sporosarcina]|uniref:Single-stranded DNA-binding protein n=1 Tax=Sporosarcina ureae TaxID=1571 RepID=A0ABN4YR47_SPOUR|nr:MULTISPECIES: single-stranded DNA-binding protein [Sporosarcina]ARF14307.1 single-stranded DNA-binding protein [Sporosarcina ureae]PIC57213.1 single-stranded DNA-binding protein [Sporosarcina sp. P10]PIC60595.1 single-stranded DNA-binding protein [Sporosarcina sp. P12(2017)]PIC77237.1 single-stranded DNA-binding protein [Sporosarcina sp. P19]